MLKKDSSPPRETEEIITKTNQEDEAKEVELTEEELNTQLGSIKDEANVEYKNKSYLMAIAKFTEGITLYHKHKNGKTLKELTTKATQLYTNRALSWH